MLRSITSNTTIALLGATVLATMAYADTLHVPGEYATIQAGIDAAQPGDTVLVADDTYTGLGNRDLDFGGKAITVRSENGPGNCTVDCESAGCGFLFETGETRASVLDGFTVTNANGMEGGAIVCFESSPTITSCVLTGNIAEAGAAICCDFASPLITDCIITDNEADLDEAGGILSLASDPIIVNCIITDNSTGGVGGGIHLSGGSPMISACTIAGNDAGSYGGGISCGSESSATIVNCTIAGNSAGTVGGGLACLDLSDVAVINCRITENVTTYDGGAVYVSDCSPTFTNCTISENESAVWSAAVFCDGGNPTFTNCILWKDVPQEISVVAGAVDVSYSDVAGGWAGDGNLDVDPIFGHKMHFPQGPDPTGWDIYSNPGNMLADDWRCSETGLITNIHLWSSWCQDIEGGLNYIVVCIHEDIPAGTGGIPYSRPGEMLWEWSSGGGYIVREVSPPSPQGWFDPITGDYNYPDHQRYFQYSMYVPPEVAFEQQAGTIYWLRPIAFPRNPMDDRWGWKSARTHWNDAAVYWDDVEQIWQPLADPMTGQPLDLAFVLTSGNDPADWENNDYRLSAGSQCIDAGDNTAVPADVADLDVDGDLAERTPVDLSGIRRFTDDPLTNDTGITDLPDYPLVVDLGAHEFGLRGDVDGDCDVDLADLAELLGSYNATAGVGYDHGDLDCDGDVDLADLAELLGHYGDVCP